MKNLGSPQAQRNAGSQPYARMCSSASAASEDTTLLDCFDTDHILASPLSLKKPLGSMNSIWASAPLQKPQTTRPSLNRMDSEKRWKSGSRDSDQGVSKPVADTTENSGIEVDEAIQVGFAVLRALKTSNHSISDNCTYEASPTGLRRAGKKEEIMDHLHGIIAMDMNDSGNSSQMEALGALADHLNHSHTKPLSSQSFGSGNSPSVPGDGIPTKPSRRQSIDCMSLLADDQSELNSSIPSLVDIESPDSKRGQMNVRIDAVPSLLPLTSEEESSGSDAHRPLQGRVIPCTQASRSQLQDSSSSTQSFSLRRGKAFSVSQRPLEGRGISCIQASRSQLKHSSTSTQSFSLRCGKAPSLNGSEKSSSVSPVQCCQPDNAGLELKNSFFRERNGVESRDPRQLTSPKSKRTNSMLDGAKRSPREYRRSQSDRKLLQRSMINVDISPIVKSRSSSITSRSSRCDKEPRLSKSNRSLCSDTGRRKSATRRELRKCLSERRLTGTKDCAALDDHLAKSKRKGRRPRSERSLGSTSKKSTTSRVAHPKGDGRKTEINDIKFPIHSKRKPHARALNKRSLSLDAARMRSSEVISRNETIEPVKPMPSLSRNQWSSLRSIGRPGESLRKLGHVGISLRNISASGARMGSSLFRKKERNMDFDSKVNTNFEASMSDLSGPMRSKSLVLDSNRITESTLQSSLPPPPPPPPNESPSLTPKLKPPRKDSLPYSSPGSNHRSSVKSPGKIPTYPRKSMSLSRIDYTLSPLQSKPVLGDAAVASLSWVPTSAPASQSPMIRRAKKGEKLKRLLHLQARNKSTPLAEQDVEEESIIIPLHFLDAEREITRKQKKTKI